MRAEVRRSRARRGEGDRLKDEILDATEALLLKTQDAESVSIRAVAEAVGVTPPSIYMHFASKEDLIFACCEKQFLVLGDHMRRAGAKHDDPVEQVKEMGRAYVRFGLERPEQYRFLFMARTPEWAAERILERVDEISGFGMVVEAVQRCIDTKVFAKQDAYVAACGMWAGVHGVVSLLISKPTFPWPDREALIEHVIQTTCVALAR